MLFGIVCIADISPFIYLLSNWVLLMTFFFLWFNCSFMNYRIVFQFDLNYSVYCISSFKPILYIAGNCNCNCELSQKTLLWRKSRWRANCFFTKPWSGQQFFCGVSFYSFIIVVVAIAFIIVFLVFICL